MALRRKLFSVSPAITAGPVAPPLRMSSSDSSFRLPFSSSAFDEWHSKHLRSNSGRIDFLNSSSASSACNTPPYSTTDRAEQTAPQIISSRIWSIRVASHRGGERNRGLRGWHGCEQRAARTEDNEGNKDVVFES